MSEAWHGGKGSRFRPTDKKKYDENWDRIFGKTTASVHQDGFRPDPNAVYEPYADEDDDFTDQK